MRAELTISGLHTHLSQRLPQLPKGAGVLDLGCGSGAWLARLGGLGLGPLYGVDRDAAQAEGVDATIVAADIDGPDFDVASALQHGRKFGLITAIELIEHLANPGRMLVLAAGALSPDGWLLVTTPNVHSLVVRLRWLLTGRLSSFDAKGDKTHVQPLWLEGFSRILRPLGLTVIQQWTYPERGSLIHGRSLRAAASLLRPFMPDGLPGDTLCLWIRKQGAA